jgi:protein-L-isoaspartate O-methyltransferase
VSEGWEWVKPFFDTVSGWYGPPRIQASDHARVALATRFAPRIPMRVLELGAGGGTTSVVAAQAGHTVTAVDLSSAKVAFAADLVRRHGVAVDVIEADFYTVDPGGPFDCVMYWNGFGVGTDADQRTLLRRIHDEWLAPDGVFVLEVFSPMRWLRSAGERVERTAQVELVNTNDFDPVLSRFSDTWWPAGHEAQAVTQSARCYTPADFSLLLEGTGFRIVHAMAQGVAFDPGAPADSSHPIWDSWAYACVLAREGATPDR